MRRGMMRGRGKGYKNVIGRDPAVHSQSARGIKQPQRIVLREHKPQKDIAKFYDYLWQKNKGEFYHGYAETPDGQEGLGFGVLGKGKYYAWEDGVAKAFARISAERKGGNPKVEKIKLQKDLKLLDAQSKTMCDIKKSLGVKCFEKVGDPIFASVLTEEIKKKGYDGVISDDRFDGLVIFENKNLSLFEFQDKNQEKIIHSGWEKGNSYRFVLEGTGDIFRELTNPKKFICKNYVNEKIRRIENHFEDMKEGRKYFPKTGVHPEDSIEFSYENNKDKFDMMIKLWKNQPYKTKKQKIAIDLNLAMLKGRYDKAKKLIKLLK